ncbi:SEFIR domain-containing protein [Amycolatopsis xylanica]|uniref:SEFIR domain-containing protein n=1 Tax=Amycolatopsis xylanica TaxID=589385 RepID=A0A1H3K0H1_9PSEU|nr:toll/interleukin-1 receptor domain-containing protein [Amycolatopsis xylanica]SDY45004.1 SEFIR domain-containing protein [Amycolatopsis xylanica]
MPQSPRVFLSYTHDDDRHCADVLDFATFLTRHGIDVVIDVWAGVDRQDWQAWMARHIPEMDYVIVVASAGYRRMGDGFGPNDRNRGGQAEAAILRDLLQGDRAKWTAKILPVLLPGHEIDEIPLFLQPRAADRYPITSLTPAGTESLLRALTRQAAHIRPPLGTLPVLPPQTGPGAVHAEPSLTWTPLPEPLPVIWRSELTAADYHPQGATVELHLVPVTPGFRHGVKELQTISLPALGREQGFFTPAEGLEVSSSDTAVWANSTDRATGTGVAVHRSGQRSCWFQLPLDQIGSVLDEADLTEHLGRMLGLLTGIDLPLADSVAPTIGMDPVGLVRLGRPDPSATTITFPLQQRVRIRFDAEESIPSEALRHSAGAVAEELTARLATALQD